MPATMNDHDDAPKSTNITWHHGDIGREEREQLRGQKVRA